MHPLVFGSWLLAIHTYTALSTSQTPFLKYLPSPWKQCDDGRRQWKTNKEKHLPFPIHCENELLNPIREQQDKTKHLPVDLSWQFYHLLPHVSRGLKYEWSRSLLSPSQSTLWLFLILFLLPLVPHSSSLLNTSHVISQAEGLFLFDYHYYMHIGMYTYA